jgi:hypothetical protein
MPTRAERNATNPDLGVLSARLLFSAQRELFSKLAAQGFDDIQARQANWIRLTGARSWCARPAAD